MKSPISNPILLLLLSLPTLFQTAFDLDIIQRSCKSAAKTDPYVDYKLCVQTLRANPNSKAATFKELVLISITQSKANATEIGSEISELLKGSEKWGKGKYSLGCLKGCLELYTEAVSGLELALGAVKMGDNETANIKVSAAMDAALSCEDGYKEKDGEVSPLTEINCGFFQLNAISLAFINMAQ
ncbi:putative invertase inhibitor [Cucurbita pepo subsp. pepo]|uniref:putative invertase inhibitor n=1 Tax=Cucurbita pepo subsp. pepo TaxID=3664 RepID=UPI000C9D3736|nr:putative invertase inhibitor [Cucurbita pepo subsp. pepo]